MDENSDRSNLSFWDDQEKFGPKEGKEYLERAWQFQAKEEFDKMEECYLKAVELGDCEAMCAWGLMKSNGGPTCKVDKEEAIRLFRQAADKGWPRAFMNLGLMLKRRSKKGEPEYEEGEMLLLKVSSLSSPMLFSRSILISFFQAADSKHPFVLGYLFNEGLGGLRKDYKEAVKHYTIAADQGHLGNSTSFVLRYV